MSFGQLVKGLRIVRKKTLRQFCLEHGHDPSNWSKIERGVNPPPKDENILARWAEQLGLERGTEAWDDFMCQADVARGDIPRELLRNERLLEKLPLFFRTVRGAELGEKELDDLIRKIKEAHTPDDEGRQIPPQ